MCTDVEGRKCGTSSNTRSSPTRTGSSRSISRTGSRAVSGSATPRVSYPCFHGVTVALGTTTTAPTATPLSSGNKDSIRNSVGNVHHVSHNRPGSGEDSA